MSFSAKNGDHGASDFQVITPNKDAANEINSTEIPFSLDELMYI